MNSPVSLLNPFLLWLLQQSITINFSNLIKHHDIKGTSVSKLLANFITYPYLLHYKNAINCFLTTLCHPHPTNTQLASAPRTNPTLLSQLDRPALPAFLAQKLFHATFILLSPSSEIYCAFLQDGA